jgi:hypothetical protein
LLRSSLLSFGFDFPKFAAQGILYFSFSVNSVFSVRTKSIFSFPSCTWERECPRNFVASVQEGKHSFTDKCVPKYNLGTRGIQSLLRLAFSGGPDNLLVRVAEGDRKRSANEWQVNDRFLRAARARATK